MRVSVAATEEREAPTPAPSEAGEGVADARNEHEAGGGKTGGNLPLGPGDGGDSFISHAGERELARQIATGKRVNNLKP